MEEKTIDDTGKLVNRLIIIPYDRFSDKFPLVITRARKCGVFPFSPSERWKNNSECSGVYGSIHRYLLFGDTARQMTAFF
jgi:hypothetical protein